MSISATLKELGLEVFERGWLSCNSVLCADSQHPTTLIDTGYGSHADLTVALIQHALGGRRLDNIVNTHLHSDHCGGNAALKSAYPSVKISVPGSSLEAVSQWDASALTYERTAQRCDRFQADAGLKPNHVLTLGAIDWQIHAAPGHDMDAVMLFQPETGVLIAGDALWERRLAVVFPELEALEGFEANAQLFDHIESLDPRIVIPGHGRPFLDVGAALEASRKRLKQFQRNPESHTAHARRALLMFHMLEHQTQPEAAAINWFCRAPILSYAQPISVEVAIKCIESLLKVGVLTRREGQLTVNDSRRASGP